MSSLPLPSDLRNDASDLRALAKRFAKGMNDKDVDAVMSVYAPGKSLVVFDTAGEPNVHVGWEQYRKAWRQLFAGINGPLQFTLSDLQLDVNDDIAYGHCRRRARGVHGECRTPFDYTVRVTDVYRKIAGTWLIVQEHISRRTGLAVPQLRDENPHV